MERAKHAYGSRQNLAAAIESGKVDAFDILLLSGENETPAMGWVDSKTGKPIIIEQTDLSGVEAELAKKANAADVDAKLEAALAEHHTNKYEVVNAPDGTLINYNEKEIRICCPKNSVWTKQTVGEGGNSNCYYVTLKTYVYDDNVVGYKEHIGTQADAEILTDLKTDKYGRYQLTWLAVAMYDEATDTWTYYGANSTKDKYIGWDYTIQFFDTNGKMVASDSIRINLSNEDCHSVIKPYYGVSEMTEAVETANAYTDAKIAEMETKIEESSSYEIIEF